MQERRSRRSNDRITAAQYFIESFARRLRSEALALASDDGLLICGEGAAGTLETLAALSVTSRRPARIAEELGAKDPVHSARLDVGGTTLTVAAVGGSPLPAQELAAGIRRILFA